MNYYKVGTKNLSPMGITKDGHTMMVNDIVKDLNRMKSLEDIVDGIEYHPARLEYFSGLIIQGFSANTMCWEDKNILETAKIAIAQAKELIKQLEEENK